ncbi:MAG: hypothetical protein FJW30_11170 [Acidobacteria bacterium]|nr:hypothetical protein [Acidobacteriota bacterium]
MSNRLRQAFDSEPIPPGMETRIAARPAPRRLWMWPAMAAAAAGLIFGVLYINKLRTVDAILAATEPALPEILRVGLRDHVYCAVMRKYNSAPKPVAKLAEDLPAKMTGLAEVVTAKVPPAFKLHVSHVCKFKGRSFVHLALHDGQRLLSVILTKRENAESIPALLAAGSNGYEVAAFEKGEWLVYIASDASGAESRSLVAAIAPAVREFLDRV